MSTNYDSLPSEEIVAKIFNEEISVNDVSSWTIYNLYRSGRLDKATGKMKSRIEEIVDLCQESL